jgi:hypothetical protein
MPSNDLIRNHEPPSFFDTIYYNTSKLENLSPVIIASWTIFRATAGRRTFQVLQENFKIQNFSPLKNAFNQFEYSTFIGTSIC